MGLSCTITIVTFHNDGDIGQFIRIFTSTFKVKNIDAMDKKQKKLCVQTKNKLSKVKWLNINKTYEEIFSCTLVSN